MSESDNMYNWSAHPMSDIDPDKLIEAKYPLVLTDTVIANDSINEIREGRVKYHILFISEMIDGKLYHVSLRCDFKKMWVEGDLPEDHPKRQKMQQIVDLLQELSE